MLELIVLSVPGCPNALVLEERLSHVLSGYPEISITRHVIDMDTEAARLGMHGSPTLLINRVDVFAPPDTPASVSCRLYRDEQGAADGAPSETALRKALDQASRAPTRS